MPSCCQVMYGEQTSFDRVLHAPPKGKGASLTVRYQLPRSGLR
jgi:5-methylcytosine-specific restriction protein A